MWKSWFVCNNTCHGVTMNLDELQKETEKLLSLLKDRQTGMYTWNEFLSERLSNIKKMIDAVGIK